MAVERTSAIDRARAATAPGHSVSDSPATAPRPGGAAVIPHHDALMPEGLAAVEDAAVGDTALPEPFALARSLEQALAVVNADAHAPSEIRDVAQAVLQDEVDHIRQHFERRAG